MKPKYEARHRRYDCHPETCNHEEHYSYDVWNNRDVHWMNDGAATRKECEDIANTYNSMSIPTSNP